MRFLSWLDAVRNRMLEQGTSPGSSRRRDAKTPIASELERLEDKSLLAASALFIAGELNVVSDSNDSIEIRSTGLIGSTRVEVILNGTPTTAVSSIPASAVTSIVVRGGNLQNIIDLSQVSRVTYPNLASIDVDAGHGADTVFGSLDIGGETLIGNHGDDLITCQFGNSTVFAGDGNDTIDGGGGNDQIFAEDGNDSVLGGDGNDTIDAHDGDDFVDAGAGNDSVIGGDGEDSIIAGAGNDTVNGMMGVDEIDGGTGNDSLLGGAGDDLITGGAGDDWISSNDGRDTVLGGADNDTLNGDGDADSLDGGEGNDAIYAGAGNDSVQGGDGQDTLIGGAGHDLMDGGLGSDQLKGQAGNDTLYGGTGLDSLDGGAGDDTLDAGDAPLPPAPPAPVLARLFAVANNSLNSIVELNPVTGAEINRFTAPEATNASGDGLAFDGTSLFFINGFGTNLLYEMNPDTGVVLDSDLIPRPTNQRYDGLATLNGKVYIQDSVNDDILEYDPVSDGVVRVLDINAVNAGTNLLGGLAGATNPDRLVATIANGQTVIEINPETGLITSRFTPQTPAAGTYNGLGVVDDLIYLGSSRTSVISPLSVASPLDIFTRTGELRQTLSLPYPVSAFGADDIGVLASSVPNDGQFDIVLNLPGGLTPSQTAAFTAAELRWESVIRGDLPDVTIPTFGVIDDLVVRVTTRAIDGIGGVLGQTTIDAQRADSSLPALATIEFDADDIAGLEASGQLTTVALHQIGHALGFGTVWADQGLIAGAGTTNPRFTGALATSEYNRRFNLSDPNVPLENFGGPGSVDAHWREARFLNEVMSSVLNSGVVNPLSRITLAAMADMGYVVNLAQADPYTPTGNAGSLLTNTNRSLLSQGRWLLPANSRDRVSQLVAGVQQPWARLSSGTALTSGATGTGSASASASSNRTEIMFNELPTQPADNVTLNGVTFDFKINGLNSTDATFGNNVGLGTNTTINLSNPVLEGNSAGVLTIDFAVPVTNLSFAVARSSLTAVDSGVQVSLFDATLTSISTTPLDLAPQRTFAEGQFNYTGLTGVRRVVLDFSSAIGGASGVRFAIDNLSFELSSALPTPAVVGGETLLGGDGNDLLIGRDGNDLLNGQAGNDTIRGGDGNDSLLGGGGNDSLDGEAGNDTLRGFAGLDTLIGGAGQDSFLTLPGEGVDSVDGGEDADTFEFRGTNAQDIFDIGQTVAHQLTVKLGTDVQTLTGSIESVLVSAAGGADRIFVHDLTGVPVTELRLLGGNSNDRMVADAGASIGNVLMRMLGEAGDDFLSGSDSGESLSGGDGQDTIEGNGGADTIDGGAGNDSILGGSGNDVIVDSLGQTTINGGDGDDSLTGGIFNDVLDGGAGNDTLIGLNGDDLLNGMDGNDSLVGGSDNDSLLGGGGNDTLDGGTDNDTIQGQDGNDLINGFHGHDWITGGTGNDTISGGDGSDTIIADGGNDLIGGGDGNDLVYGNDGDDTVLGGDGNDTLRGGSGRDIVLGGDGNDFVDGQGSIDTLAGGEGTDVVVATAGEINENFVLASAVLAKLL